METSCLLVKPGRKRFKSLVVKTVFLILGRSFHAASKLDLDIKKEIETWDEGFKFMMKVFPESPSMIVEKRKGILVYRGSKGGSADLTIIFKSIESAFLVFTAQCGTCRAFAESRVIVSGDISKAMSLVRCLNILQRYLFPLFINRFILKRPPSMPWYKQFIRAYIYLLGVPFGL
ncbi:MAG: hypothetical protein JW836_09580 [Deltaproteobacteria bacterium]|nr:hypothetical protein [Deltaproteobacteria bacterium]